MQTSTKSLIAASVALVATSAYAASGNWNVNNSGNWSTATNWSSNPTVPGTVAGDTINFTNNIGTSTRTVTIDTTSRTAGVMAIGDSDNTHSFILAASGAATLTFNNNGSGATLTESGSVLDTISAPIILADNLAITAGGSLTVSGPISQTGGARTLTKSGAGTLTLSVANSYTGLTTINNGIVIIGNNTALGTSAAGTTIIGSNAVAFQGTVLDLGTTGLTLAESFSLNGNGTGRVTIRNNSSANQTLNGNIDVTSATNSAAITSNSVSDNGSITVNSDISGTLTSGAIFFLRGASTNANNRVLGNVNIAGDLIKADAGTWTVGAASKTYSWTNTSVAGGTLRMGLAGVMPTATVLTVGQSGASTATFDLNGFNQTVAGIVQASGATTGTRTITSATAATLTVGSASDFTYGGVLTGAGLALTKTGAGNQTLTGTNSYAGLTTISQGTLTLGNASDTLANTGAINVNGGTLALGTNSDTVGAVTLTSGSITGSGAATLTGTSYAVQSGNVSAILAGSAVALTKSTAGTVTLSGANTYTGATAVNAGTLLVNGSTASASAVTVANTATLGGTGSIGGSVTVNSGGTLAPGASIQSLATGTLSLNAGSSFAYEIDNDAAATLAGDLTAVTGNLNLALTNDVNLNMSELGSGSWALGEKLTLISYTGTWNGGLFDLGGVDLSDGANFSFSGATWTINYDDTLAGSNFTGDLTSPSFVTITVVPEPTTLGLLAMGAVGLMRRRRVA